MLSALTNQVMNFIENQSSLLREVLQSSIEHDIVLNNLFMIHTTIVMLCVIVAFFLPAMARPGYEKKWGRIATLGLSVLLDFFSKLSSILAKQDEKISFFILGAIISIMLIWLILLLISAAIASESIRNITAQKIPIILGEPADNTWDGVEGQVLKSWIVACACDLNPS